jgi:hypothetical protein
MSSLGDVPFLYREIGGRAPQQRGLCGLRTCVPPFETNTSTCTPVEADPSAGDLTESLLVAC